MNMCKHIQGGEEGGGALGERGTNGMESRGKGVYVIATVVGKKWKWSDGRLEKVKGKERKEKAERQEKGRWMGGGKKGK